MVVVAVQVTAQTVCETKLKLGAKKTILIVASIDHIVSIDGDHKVACAVVEERLVQDDGLPTGGRDGQRAAINLVGIGKLNVGICSKVLHRRWDSFHVDDNGVLHLRRRGVLYKLKRQFRDMARLPDLLSLV